MFFDPGRATQRAVALLWDLVQPVRGNDVLAQAMPPETYT
jgi:hypothetical protein